MNSSIKTIASAFTAAQKPQTPPVQPPVVELLTQVQMAERLGITRRTLHTWVLNGTVPMIKVRGYCRFEPAKVWAALLRHEVSPLPNASALRRGIAPAPQAEAPAPAAPAGDGSSRSLHAPQHPAAPLQPNQGIKMIPLPQATSVA